MWGAPQKTILIEKENNMLESGLGLSVVVAVSAMLGFSAQ